MNELKLNVAQSFKNKSAINNRVRRTAKFALDRNRSSPEMRSASGLLSTYRPVLRTSGWARLTTTQVGTLNT